MKKEIAVIAVILGFIVVAVMIWVLLSLGLLYCLNTLFNAELEYNFINITAGMLFVLIIESVISIRGINLKIKS